MIVMAAMEVEEEMESHDIVDPMVQAMNSLRVLSAKRLYLLDSHVFYILPDGFGTRPFMQQKNKTHQASQQ